MKDAVEEDRVHVRVEPQITRRTLHHEHRPALPDDAVFLGETSLVERKHGVREFAHHRAEATVRTHTNDAWSPEDEDLTPEQIDEELAAIAEVLGAARRGEPAAAGADA